MDAVGTDLDGKVRIRGNQQFCADLIAGFSQGLRDLLAVFRAKVTIDDTGARGEAANRLDRRRRSHRIGQKQQGR